MANIVALIAMVAHRVSGLARRSRLPVEICSGEWSGMGLAAILAILVFGVAALTAVGIVRQHARSAPVPNVKVEATPEQIARGKAVTDSFCSGCHRRPGR